MTNKINICFMGSPKFSLETLDILNKNENINLSLVVSGKDKKEIEINLSQQWLSNMLWIIILKLLLQIV